MSKRISIADLPQVTQFTAGEIIEQTAPPLLWELKVPSSIDAERIEVNMTRLAAYHRVGALSTSIVTEYQGERTEFTPGVSGINMDGSAIASKAGVKHKADRSKQEILQDPYIPTSLLDGFGKATAIHIINKAELAQNTANTKLSSRGDLSREEAWAIELDGALRESFRNVTKSHLVEQRERVKRYVEYIGLSAWAGAYGQNLIDNRSHNALYTPLLYLGIQTILTGGDALIARHKTRSTLLSEKRWSLFLGGHQSDRYIALNGLSRLPGLVTYCK